MSPERERGGARSTSIATRPAQIRRTCNAEPAIDRLSPRGDRPRRGAADCRYGGVRRCKTVAEIVPAIKVNEQNDLRASNGGRRRGRVIARERLRARPAGGSAERVGARVRPSSFEVMRRDHNLGYCRSPLLAAGRPPTPKLRAHRSAEPMSSASHHLGRHRLGAGR